VYYVITNTAFASIIRYIYLGSDNNLSACLAGKIQGDEMKEFNSLELFFKRDILKKHAHHLISTDHYQFTAKLYCWNKCFIEVYYNNQREEITRITLADKTSLNKYLKRISLADLGQLSVL
jgi:hypothetical protein